MGNHDKHGHLKIRIAVAGAAEMGFLGNVAYEEAQEIGREVVKQGGILVSGATTGFPLWAAKGAKEEGGISVGLSPASSEVEHVETYRLPLDYMDLIIYTGFGYPGRDLLMTRTADAVIIGPGRIGTIHEFTIAFEDSKPVGILTGDWEDTDDVIKNIIEKGHRPNDKVFFEENPKKLVARLMKMAGEIKERHPYVYKNDDNIGGVRGERIL
jgi:uncharacterized protein (TIGR00725 family)